MAFEATRQEKSDALKEFIRSDAFKKQYGDWEKGESSLVLGEDGEPLVLWHGSPNKFEAFDFSHAGENTGITEYTLKSTGEKTVSDSSKTIFFTDNRQLAVSYAFLARTQTLGRIQGQLTDIGALLRSPEGTFLSHIHTLNDFKNTVRELRKENDAELNVILDKLPDLDGKNPISSMPEAEREALAKEFFVVRDNYAEMYRMNNIGGISNRLNNVLKMQEYLPYFRENFKRLCGNDTSVLTENGEDFTKYNMSFYSGEESQGRSVHVFWQNDDKRMMASGFRQKPVYLDALTVSERKELLDKIDSDLAQCIKEYNRDIKKAGFEEGTHLYPVFLKAAKPLVHDYQGSSFPDKYKPNEKYDTAYVAARQSAKAIRDGYDAVVYKNIRDPFLGTTYGVFSTDNIVMIDRSLMRQEDLSPRLEVSMPVDKPVLSVGYARYASSNSIELSSANKMPVHVNGKLFRGCDYSAFWMKYKPGTKLSINGRLYDVGGKSVEDVYQTVIKGYPSKEEGKGKAPSKDSPLYGMDSAEFARKGYLPLVGIYAQQYPEKLDLLKERISELSASGPVVLTDRFWNQKTNACQAIAWAMFVNGEQMDYSLVTSQGLTNEVSREGSMDVDFEKQLASGSIRVDGYVKEGMKETIVSLENQDRKMSVEQGLGPEVQ